VSTAEQLVPAGASVEVVGVGKRFQGREGEVVALADVDLVAEPGTFVSIIGPSGCGKSTLFNIVAGLMEPSAGEVRLGGQRVDRRAGEIAYMPQKDLLFPWRTIIDNAIVGLQVAGVSRREARRRAEPLIERFGLTGFARAYPPELSGGMRQRTAFLRTVIQGRPAMLLDEPFGALDSLTRADMQRWLLGVWEEFRTTVVFVTHDVAEAVFLSDRVYVMAPRPGRICAIVDVDLPRPRDLGIEETDAFTAIERLLRRELRLGAAGGAHGPASGGAA
jgi:ABC-type nitrate/sulfonate/bicarbonate transport system ATPase subunit